MRIALVSQEYPPETAKGGIGTQTYAKAHGLAALGHEMHVISRAAGPAEAREMDKSVHVTRVPGFAHRLPLYTEVADWITYSAEVAAAVAALHNRAPLDLVDFPEWAGEGYVHLLNQTEWNRIPTVIHLHGPLVMFAHTMGWPDLNSEFYRTGTAMEGTCLRLADAVFSSSRCSADWCARHYGVDRATVPILHVGVDTRLFAPQNVPKARRPTILFVGKLARNKGIMLLLEAACALAHEIPDLRLRVIGGGDDALVSSLRKTAAAAGKPDLLELVGFVTRDNLPLELSRVHVFAAPSMYEGGPGFVYLEAMACGLPVVACEGSGAAEVITDHESGLLVPPNDLVALVVALRWLLADPPARQVMGERARRHVIETADSAVCLKRIEEFYKEVIARAKPVS